MKVTLIANSPEPEKVIAAAAKLCYSKSNIDDLLDGLDEQRSSDFVEMLSDIGHESPIEHVSFTFGIEGVSRALLAQITRHRLASFSVQSQRYVKVDNFKFVTPPEIEEIPQAKEEFLVAMNNAISSYNNLADILEKKHIKSFLESGVSEKSAKIKAQKKAIEDARFVLPNASETKMIITMNARSLMNFFKLRCCNRAQWEIKAVADEMLKICCDIAPTLFKNAGPSCINGTCSEGKMTCGKANEMSNFYKNLKNK
ncbi:MAG: FAD-dependent thymidylate synthase [Oscillospiraceae bacterium]